MYHKQATCRFVWCISLYSIYYGSPTIVMMISFIFLLVLVLLNERIPSKYNGLRLNKATTVPNTNTVIKKGVGKRNKPYIYCGEDKGIFQGEDIVVLY